MKFELWQIDKTRDPAIEASILKLQKRIRPFHTLKIKTIKGAGGKKTPIDVLKAKEGDSILNRLEANDFLILLDASGKQWDSRSFAKLVEEWKDIPGKRGIFLIGGAYGFSPEVYQRANYKLSLSSMTFTHQLIRLIFMEQFYRAFTIIHNLPYHND